MAKKLEVQYINGKSKEVTLEANINEQTYINLISTSNLSRRMMDILAVMQINGHSDIMHIKSCKVLPEDKVLL